MAKKETNDIINGISPPSLKGPDRRVSPVMREHFPPNQDGGRIMNSSHFILSPNASGESAQASERESVSKGNGIDSKEMGEGEQIFPT